jgi:hypothetical protein
MVSAAYPCSISTLGFRGFRRVDLMRLIGRFAVVVSGSSGTQ